MTKKLVLTLLTAALAGAGCSSPPLTPAGFPSARTDPIDAAIDNVVRSHRMPGAVYHLERGAQVYEQAYGRASYDGVARAIGTDTVFDIASLSKVVATAPSVLLLAEEGKLDLEAKLVRYLPECAGGGRDAITIRQLLTHTSGLPAGLPAKPAWEGKAAALALACAMVPTHTPGTAFRYSDVNYILLGLIVEKLSGMGLDAFAQARLFAPLGMRDTGYLPLQRHAARRIAPTQRIEGGKLQGVVHDPTIRRMGGVGGSAGVFSTASDLARFARMLLGDGQLDGVRILQPASVALMTTVQSGPAIAQQRAMGMDINSPYARPRGSLYPVGSYGHTGFTGCILWVDPRSRSFYVFLSNRVYPDDSANILPLYAELGTLSAQAVR